MAPLILSLGCNGAVSASAAFCKEILCRRVFCVLFLCSILSPARLCAFHALSCSHLTSLARISCSFWIRSASAWPFGFSANSPWIWFLIRTFQSSVCRLKKTCRFVGENPVERSVLGCSVWGSPSEGVGSRFDYGQNSCVI